MRLEAQQVGWRHYHCGLIENALQLVIRVFLDSLGVLKFLDQLHFYAFHIHDFFLLHQPYLLLVIHFFVLAALCSFNLPLSFLGYFLGSQALLLIDNWVLHSVFRVKFEVHMLSFLFILLHLDFCLLALLLLREINCFLDFTSFFIASVFNVDVLRGLHLQHNHFLLFGGFFLHLVSWNDLPLSLALGFSFWEKWFLPFVF